MEAAAVLHAHGVWNVAMANEDGAGRGGRGGSCRGSPIRALVFLRLLTPRKESPSGAPRWVLKRQLERASRARLHREDGLRSRAYLFRSPFDERAPSATSAYAVSRYLEDLPHLQTTGKPLVRAIRKRHGGGAGARGVSASKGDVGQWSGRSTLRYEA